MDIDTISAPNRVLDGTRAWIERKMNAARLQMSPTPHLIIEDFFPDDVYQKVIAFNPFRQNLGEAWGDKRSAAYVASRTPYHARKQINFHADSDFVAPMEQRAFWTALKDLFLADDWFIKVVMRKYPDYFALRFGELTQDADFVPLLRRELFLQRHEPGYYLGPHTDVPTRIFTCIFAFADRPGYEAYGTQFLVHRDRLTRCWGNNHHAPEDFEVRVLAPYKPNNFLLFFKTRHSFHAVPPITDDVPNQRYGMQFQLYEPSGGLFRDLSMPELMEVRHKATTANSRLRRLLRTRIS